MRLELADIIHLDSPFSGRLGGSIVAIEKKRIRIPSEEVVPPYHWIECFIIYFSKGHTSPEDGVCGIAVTVLQKTTI